MVVSEQSLSVREGAVLIPDVCLLPADNQEHGIVTRPALLCIEILSPSDRFSYTVKKCDEYLRWGVPACWILDPEEKRAWFYDAAGLHPVASDGVLRTGDIELALKKFGLVTAAEVAFARASEPFLSCHKLADFREELL
jgi:Uma2 family endonuclease